MEINVTELTRREALVKLLRAASVGAASAGVGVWLSKHSSRPEAALASAAKRGHTVPADGKYSQIAVLQGDDPAALVREAIRDLGGMQRFALGGMSYW